LRRSNPELAVARWRGLASGKWSLVDKFESDGKRFIVAKANNARVPHIADLSDREMQVLAHAALGHHAKLIAYELGIAASTVRVLMMRAARKLNTRTSRAAVQRFIELRSFDSA
jgi:DNA-binding CsgD family transcriptional regulator